MDIDKVIAQLFDAKPITEQEVKVLCDTVSPLHASSAPHHLIASSHTHSHTRPRNTGEGDPD